MRLCSVKFENHPILKNLKLDFTDKKGNPVNTIIFAGENGCGKTTILEELSDLWNYTVHDGKKKDTNVIAEVLLDEDELNKLIDKMQIPDDPHRLTGRFWVKQNMVNRPWSCFSIEYETDMKQKIPLNENFMSQLGPFAKSIYSTVDINYRSGRIATVSSMNVDDDKSIRKKSDSELAHTINQMLIDIDALDNSDLGNWVRNNSGRIPPENIKFQRINRFAKAFSTMFDSLSFYKVDNINNAKTILFKKGNTEIPISQLSSGEKQIVYRGAFFLKDIKFNMGNLVFIDEPEISLHPEWQKKILHYYQSIFTDEKGQQTSQLFVATHSPFIIHNTERHDDKVIVLQKQKDESIITLDKPEYYDCSSYKVVEDSFSLSDFSSDKIPLIFLEGRTDEMYLNKAQELYGNSDYKYKFQWVGHLNEQGKEENTGSGALNRLKSFILGHPNCFPNKVVLLYDCDTNKKTEKLSNQLIVKCLEKQMHVRYQKGIENLLVLSENFNYEKYYISKETTSDYGETKRIEEFKKMDLAKYICEELQKEEQQIVLKKVGEVVQEIEQELYGNNT